ncbi:zinc finger MYND domain-containing protein 11-like isoform X2 [Branchiostoma floridae]|uniref:Zinc finger MYND domain-containing protein 11-like isoform X2 n=1 Tax=Branchiostoma floridae TaxID=7739 RepID=A0A9J7LVQ3_BRAFL|nr:zinc finger MYND domain-containing protein 11-like isoform X2 [Branchiostoma floridae]
MVRPVKRRSADPQVVKQLWNAIGHIREQKQIANIERITKYMGREYEISNRETVKQLGHAVKDGLVIETVTLGVKGAKAGVEQEGYWLVGDDPIVPLDAGGTDPTEGEDHDWYCFECHQPGEVVLCSGCHRVYHSKCLPEECKPRDSASQWYCPVCQAMQRKTQPIKKKELNRMLVFVVYRMKEKQSRELSRKVSLQDHPNFPRLVHSHMDLSIMQQRAEECKFKCPEEFEAATRQILHNNLIYYGDESEFTELARVVLADCRHDLREIQLCKDCYMMSNSRNLKDWFIRPCDPPHALVWAKMKGFGWWPAKVLQDKDGQSDVRFFGRLHQRAWITEDCIKPIDINIQQLQKKRTAAWKRAYDEVQEHQSRLEHVQANPLSVSSESRGSSHSDGDDDDDEEEEEEETMQDADDSGDDLSEPEEPISSTSNGDQQELAEAVNQVSSTGEVLQPTPPATPQKASVSTVATQTRKWASAAEGKAPSTKTKFVQTVTSNAPACTCHEKYNKIFSDFKERMEENQKKEKEQILQDLTDKLKSEHEQDKRESLAKAAASNKSEVEQAVKKAKEEVESSKTVDRKQMEEEHKAEISFVKRRQWCYNCEAEAMYHCCWNTSYCSVKCQQEHWHAEHKKTCRRKR